MKRVYAVGVQKPIRNVATVALFAMMTIGATCGSGTPAGAGTHGSDAVPRSSVQAISSVPKIKAYDGLALSTTVVHRFEPWKQNSQGVDEPAPGLVVTYVQTGTCDSGSADDPGRADAFRCVDNGLVCFVHSGSGDPGSPLLCSTDPTSNQVGLLSQGGSTVPVSLANTEDPGQPVWVLVLVDGKKCNFLGYGTNTDVLSYDCKGNIGATVPDRSNPLWTVQEGTMGPNPSPSGPRIPVLVAYR